MSAALIADLPPPPSPREGDEEDAEPTAAELATCADEDAQADPDDPDPDPNTADPDPEDDAPGDALALYLRDVRALGAPPSHDEMVFAARRGDRNRLVEGNLRLVLDYALLRARPWNEVEDLISEGNRGLIRAAEKWDWRRGYRFSTYARFWVKRYILRERLRQEFRSGMVPESHMALAKRIWRARLELSERHGGADIPLADALAWLREHERPPHGIGCWPDEGDAAHLLAAGIGMEYLSRALGAEDGDDEGGMPATLALQDTLAARDDVERTADLREQLRAAVASEMPDVYAQRRGLRALLGRGALTEEQATLLSVRHGIPHPLAGWHAPAGWHVGRAHNFRWIATALRARSPGVRGLGRTALQRKYAATLDTLRASADPDARALARALARGDGSRPLALS